VIVIRSPSLARGVRRLAGAIDRELVHRLREVEDLPPFPPDVDCADLRALGTPLPVRVVVIGQDPHGLDRDQDGLGCE
jgi:hypothetical protein